MAVQGPYGYSTSSTQRNSDTFNFLVNDGTGGGASSLQSPATILPEVGTGTAQLTMNSTGAGTSFLNMASAAISVIGVNGNVQSSVGLGNTPAVWLSKVAGDGLLRVGLNENGTTPVMSVDATNNIVNLGNAGAAGNVNVNTGLIYTAAGGPPAAAFPATVLQSGITSGATVISVATLPAGVYVVYGQAGSSTDAGDLSARFSTVISMGAAGLCQGGGYAAVTGAYTVAPGTASLTLTLNVATTAAYSVVAYPIYLF